MADGLATLLSVLAVNLATPAFEESMRKCFVAVGLWKNESGEFEKFVYKKAGFLKAIIKPVGRDT